MEVRKKSKQGKIEKNNMRSIKKGRDGEREKERLVAHTENNVIRK